MIFSCGIACRYGFVLCLETKEPKIQVKSPLFVDFVYE
jgi:hypothetical protein